MLRRAWGYSYLWPFLDAKLHGSSQLDGALQKLKDTRSLRIADVFIVWPSGQGTLAEAQHS